MRLVIHQPHFLPWMGYFNKLAHADAFVVQDDVNYRKGYFHNRALFLGNDRSARWLTLPVHHGPSQQTLAATAYCNGKPLTKALGFVDHVYRKHPFFRDIWPPLRLQILSGNSAVSEMNLTLLRWLLQVLGLELPILQASDLVPRVERTERLIRISRILGATALIFGEGGASHCHDVSALQRAGIQILYQHFHQHHPVYEQPGVEQFVSKLSIVDALMSIGPDRTRDLIKTAWEPRQ